MAELTQQVSKLLMSFIKDSKDGYAIFDQNDILIFANYVYKDIFCIQQCEEAQCTFDSTIRHAFTQKRGVNIEAENIEDWLAYVDSARRKRQFRLFEVDLVDGRWLLFSEQLLPTGELLVQTKDITRQKVSELQLQNSVNTLNKLALTDELTQIANRRSFVSSVKSELSRSQRIQKEVTFLIIDLDHFKLVNDKYGHPAGDLVLIHVAKLLKHAIRQYDIVGRIGGEEFAVFLGSTANQKSYNIAERFRGKLATTPIRYSGEAIYVTASIGMVTYHEQVSFEQLYADADEALYQAKASGRNCIKVYLSSSNNKGLNIHSA